MKSLPFLVACLVYMLLLPFTSASALTTPTTDVPLDKTWTVTFTHPVLSSSVTDSTVYITDRHQIKQDVNIVVNGKTVTINAPVAGYAYNETYTLHIKSNILGQVGQSTKHLHQPVTKSFSTVKPFAVVPLSPTGSSSTVATYATFDEANAHLQADEAIMLDGNYLKIPSGFVATNEHAVTTLYSKPTFTKGFEFAGLAKDSELVYVDSTADYVQVQAAGQNMYVQQEDVILIPSSVAQGQSYYKADARGLWHYVYHHHGGKYDAPYLIGEKPPFLQPDKRYYSTDGIHFIDENGQDVGESYAYFQYVSPRVPTSYSAAQLDQYIADELAAKEKLSGLYTDASTKSPLLGLGTTLKKLEASQRLNALFILSLAIHESNYGMSCHAQNYQNLFGLNVTDSNDQCSSVVDKNAAKYFPTVAQNIEALATRLNTNYLDPLLIKDFRYNGTALGNKMTGMNVRYASDPYWGAKIAGHMYRIDAVLGQKDYQKYQLGRTTKSGVSLYVAPLANQQAYQYYLDWTIKRLDSMPVTLSATSTTENGWLAIISELPTSNADVYTKLTNIQILSTY